MATRDPEETIERYYDALRAGEPLHPFFADDGLVVKVGVGERLVGAEAVAAGLRGQTATTEDWVVESRDLHVGAARQDGRRAGDEDAAFAWFGDEVSMAWTDTERDTRFAFETRWSGAMVRRDGGWQFVEMHVSAPDET